MGSPALDATVFSRVLYRLSYLAKPGKSTERRRDIRRRDRHGGRGSKPQAVSPYS